MLKNISVFATGRPTTTTTRPKTAPEWPKMAHINLYDGTASAVKSDRSQGGPEMAPFLCTTGCVGLGRSVVSNIGKGSHHVCARSGGCLAEWGILGHCRRTAMVRPPRLSWSHPSYSSHRPANNNNSWPQDGPRMAQDGPYQSLRRDGFSAAKTTSNRISCYKNHGFYRSE